MTVSVGDIIVEAQGSNPMQIGAMVAGVIRIMKIQRFLFQAYFSRFKIHFSDIRGSQNKAPNKLGCNFT